MFPSDPSTPFGGPQSVAPSIMRSNSGLLGGEGGSISSQNALHSIVSPRTQFNNTNMLGNVPNMPSLVHQSFGNGGPSSGFSGPGGGHQGAIGNGASDGISSIGSGMCLNPPTIAASIMGKPNSSGQPQAQQFSVSSGNMQEFSAPPSNHQGQLQHQLIRGGLAGVGPVKLEPQVSNGQNVQSLQQLHSLGNVSPVKLGPQQIQNMKGSPTVKLEPQHLDQSLLLHHKQQQQRQQQQLLHLSRQSPQAAAASQLSLLNQQRLLQLQQQQQQQQQLGLKSLTPQRSLSQQPLQSHNLPLRSPMKPTYEPGTCARRLTRYMYEQQHRPKDNHIEFWRKFVSEFFAPNANKKWCVSMYGTGRQTAGVFPQDVWNCGICSCKPGRGFEATAEVLPRLFKIKYDSGTMEELLYVDMPREYQNSAGQIVLDYAKAIQESVFDQLRVVRDGQLRLVFSPDLKICSWEFCARRHEELIPRRLLVPQVSQIGAVAQKYQVATQNSSSSSLVPELQSNCDTFSASARQLAKAMEVPLVNDLGYTKRFIRCLQISEVVNSMKDLIDYSRETGTGPMESLVKFPRRSSATSVHCQPQEEEDQPQQQQTMGQNTVKDQNSLPADAKLVASGNGLSGVNSFQNMATNSTTTSSVGMLQHSSMNSRLQNPMSNAKSSCGGSGSQIPSPQAQVYPLMFQSPKPSTSNNAPQSCHGGLSAAYCINSANSPSFSGQQPSLCGVPDPNYSQSSGQKIVNKMMVTSQVNDGDDVKISNGVSPSNSGNCLVGNGTGNLNVGSRGSGFGNMSNGLSHSTMVNEVQAPMGSNSMTTSGGGVGIASMAHGRSMNHQQHALGGDQLFSGLEGVNGFSNFDFDWKSSP